MTLEEIIKLFTRLEKGEQPSIGFHLHRGIHRIMNEPWRYKTNQDYNESFSGFMRALSEEPYPKEKGE